MVTKPISYLPTDIKMKTFPNLFILLLICLLTFAGFKTDPFSLTEKSYEVRLLTGELWYQIDNKKDWSKLPKHGTILKLRDNDKIKLGPGSSIGILNDKNFLTIDKNGIWTIKQLVSSQKNTQSVAGPYLMYIFQNLTHAHKSIDEYAEGYMRKKGLISRGEGCTTPLMLTPEYDAILPENKTEFKWNNQPGTFQYTINLYTDWQEDSKPIYSQTVGGTSLIVDLNKELIEKGTTYYWCVYPKEKPNCARYSFKLAEDAELSEFKQKLKELTASLNYGTGLNAFIKAGLYEQNNFFGEAAREYRRAMQQDKGNALFIETYQLFLARNGRLEEAKKLAESVK
jgi:hypothetical protein